MRSTGGRIDGMSKPTSIKTSEEVRDRLRIPAEERGTTITELLAELALRGVVREDVDGARAGRGARGRFGRAHGAGSR